MRLILLLFLANPVFAAVGDHSASVDVVDYDRRLFAINYRIPTDAETTVFEIHRGVDDVTTNELCYSTHRYEFRLADLGGRFEFAIRSWDARGIERYRTDITDGLDHVEFDPILPEIDPYPALGVDVDGSRVTVHIYNVLDLVTVPPLRVGGQAYPFVDGVAVADLPPGDHLLSVGEAELEVTIEAATSYIGWFSQVSQPGLDFSTVLSVETSRQPCEILARLITTSGTMETVLLVPDTPRPTAVEFDDLFAGLSGMLHLEPADGGSPIRASATIKNSRSPNAAVIRSNAAVNTSALYHAGAGDLFIAASNPGRQPADVFVWIDGVLVHTETVDPLSTVKITGLEGSGLVEVRGAQAWIGAVRGFEVVQL